MPQTKILNVSQTVATVWKLTLMKKRVAFQCRGCYQLAISRNVTCRVTSDCGQKGGPALVNKIHSNLAKLT